MIEVVISMAIIAITLTSIGTLFNMTVKLNNRTTDILEAKNLSSRFMEQEMVSHNIESYFLAKGKYEVFVTITKIDSTKDDEHSRLVDLYQVEVEVKKDGKRLQYLKGSKVVKGAMRYEMVSR